MSWYRRLYRPGGTYFFTLVTENRSPFLCDDAARSILRHAIIRCARTRPFALNAIVLLPEHVHMIWTLPPGDADFSTRLSIIKSAFTRRYLATTTLEQPRSASRLRHRRRGIWQRHFWEHLIRDENDLNRHLDYIHYNPVKHGLTPCPHAWAHSSFSRWVASAGYDPAWLCSCDGRRPTPPTFDDLIDPAFD